MKALLLFLTLTLWLFALDITPRGYSGSVKFLQQIELKAKFKGFHFSELSDLAYDSKHKILYMVSDKGMLFSFKAQIGNSNISLTPLNATYLKRKNGKRLKKQSRDSEGLTLDSKGDIYISFEGKPKVARFNEKGIKIKSLKLPQELQKRNLRSLNKSLESLTFYPKYGFITALEYPKKGDKRNIQTIYTTSGKKWRVVLEKLKHNGITALEVTDDGNLLILERAHNLFSGFTVTLRELFVRQCSSNKCPSKVLLKMSSKSGWKLENFEGLTRVGTNRYLMISDDNDSFFSSTYLIYFELPASKSRR